MTDVKKGAAAAAPSASAEKKTNAPKKTNAALRKAKVAAGDGQIDEGKINPPKFRDCKGLDLAGKNVAEFFNVDKESKPRLHHRDFTGANLQGADFSGVSLQGCVFKGAELEGADFRRCDLRWTDFSGADVSESIMGDETENGDYINYPNIREAKGL